MKTALLTVLIGLLVIPLGIAGSRPNGSFSLEGGKGTVLVRGSGTAVGRIAKGELVVVDLSPGDQWTPRVNGVPRVRSFVVKGRDVNVFVPGGRYRITLKGEGLSLSARGFGTVTMKASSVDGGTYAIGDDGATAVPVDTTKVTFGGGSGEVTIGREP